MKRIPESGSYKNSLSFDKRIIIYSKNEIGLLFAIKAIKNGFAYLNM